MARIVVMGAGVVALGAAMLLAGDAHEVIMLERDPAAPPDNPADAWQRWQRPGLNQFRMPHAFLGGFRAIVEAELPAVSKALEAAGALRLNFIRDVLPEARTGGWRDGDECYEWLTGRRPLMEAVVAAAAAATARTVEPWYRTTYATDQHRLGEIEASIRGDVYESQDPWYHLEKALEASSGQDPDCLRALLDIRNVLRLPEQALADPELRARALRLGSGSRERQPSGPDRARLMALAGVS